MTDYNKKEDDDDTGSGGDEFEWQRRLYEVYELIHEQHEGSKAPIKGFDKDKRNPNNDDPFLNNDRHPLMESSYFSGIDEQDNNSVPQENTDPNIRNELRLQLQKKLDLTLNPGLRTTPSLKPF